MVAKKTGLMGVLKQRLSPRFCGNSILHRTQLVLGGYSLCLIAILSIVAHYVGNSLNQSNQSVINFDRLSQDIQVIHNSFLHQAKNRKNLFLRGRNSADLAKYWALVNDDTQFIQQKTTLILENPQSRPYHSDLNRFVRDYAQLMDRYRQGVTLFKENQDYTVSDRSVRGQGSQVEERLDRVLRKIQDDRQQLYLRTTEQIQTFLVLSTLGMVLVIMMGSGLLVFVVTHPMRRIVRFTRLLEAGHLAPKHRSTISTTNGGESFIEPDQFVSELAQLSHPMEDERPDEIGYMVDTYRKLSAIICDYTQQLQARDSLLNCVNAAAQCLVAHDDLNLALIKMLQILGEGTTQCRAYLLQISQDDETGAQLFNLLFEWDAPHIPPKRETGGRFPVPVDHFPDVLTTPLRAGQPTRFLARDLDGIRPAERLPGQARSLVGVPIFVSGEWWGLLGLDDCINERVWSEAEIAVLETAATAVGNAIERDRSRKAHEVAAREAVIAQERAARAAELEAANMVLMTRDRWLETTAAAARELLSVARSDVTVNAALATIGDNLNCDRLGVMRYLPTSGHLGTFGLLYEWNSRHAVRQMSDEKLLEMPASDFADWIVQLMAGESVGGLVADQKEPFRRKMQSLETLSTYAVPIFIGVESGPEFWGFMFMDYCREARSLAPAELAVFNTVATCVGSTIHREQIQRDREQAERNILLEQERERATQARAAQLQKSNEILSLRERWLEITATAANMLLLADDLNCAIAPTMKILGEGLGADRVGIMKAVERNGQNFYQMFAEWASSEQPRQTDDEALQEIPAEILGDRLNDRLMSGNWVGGDLNDEGIFPKALCEGLKSIGIQSSYSVPIFVSGQFWGVIGIDHCREKRLLSETEIAVFQTIASCIGNAIQREQIVQARETAERTALIERERAARADELEAANQILLTRDRWLKATAAAANELLSATDMTVSVDAALQTIGENLECDRIVVMRYIPASSSLGTMLTIHEWDAPGINSQLHNPDLREMSGEGLEDWFTQLMARQWVGGVVDSTAEDSFSRIMRALNVQATYSVPIFVDDQFWGMMGMDYCHCPKHLSPAEIAVFETAATCVGSAIYQAGVRRDRVAQERARLLGCVAEAANLLLCSADYQRVLPEVVRLLGEAVECDRCAIGQGIVLADTQTPAIRLRPEWKWSLSEISEAHDVIQYDDDIFFWDNAPHITQKLRNDEVVNSLVANLPEPDRSFIRAQGGIAELFVPIMIEQTLWGFITFNNCSEPRLYGEAEVSILKVAAESIAAAIARQVQDEALRNAEKAVLEEREKAARDRAAELAKINEAIRKTLTTLAASPELDQFLGKILVEMAQQLGACKVHLFLFDQPTDTLVQRLAIQDGQIYIGSGPNDPDMFHAPIPANLTPAWNIILNSQKPLTYDENLPYDATVWWPSSLDWHKAQGHKAVTCIPMKAGEQPIGFIGFCFYNRTVLTDEQLEFMQALANQAIVAIQLTRLAEQSQASALLDERNRLAREIHDTLAQAFTGVSLQLEAAKGVLKSKPDVAQIHVQRAGKMARRGLSEARRSVRALRSHALETDALFDALQKYLAEATQDANLATHCQLQGTPVPLSEDLQLNLLRIGQEAIINTLRHAQAQTLTLTLTFTRQQVDLCITDDGIGFDPQSLMDVAGFGLVGMRERSDRFSGTLNIVSSVGAGTTIEVTLPLDSNTDNEF